MFVNVLVRAPGFLRGVVGELWGNGAKPGQKGRGAETPQSPRERVRCGGTKRDILEKKQVGSALRHETGSPWSHTPNPRGEGAGRYWRVRVTNTTYR